jgi:hypothetical protein
MSSIIFITICVKLTGKRSSERIVNKYSNSNLKTKRSTERITRRYSETNLKLTKKPENKLTETYESSTSSNNIYLYPYKVN